MPFFSVIFLSKFGFCLAWFERNSDDEERLRQAGYQHLPVRLVASIRQAEGLGAPFMGLFAPRQGPPLKAGSRRPENRLGPFTGLTTCWLEPIRRGQIKPSRVTQFAPPDIRAIRPLGGRG